MRYLDNLKRFLDHKISNFVAESSDNEEALIAKKIVLAALLVSVLLLIPNTVYYRAVPRQTFVVAARCAAVTQASRSPERFDCSSLR